MWLSYNAGSSKKKCLYNEISDCSYSYNPVKCLIIRIHDYLESFVV